MEASFVFKKFDVEVVSSIFKKYPLTKGIFSTVIDKDDELVEYLGSNLRNFVFLDETVSLPIKVQYKTPKTLGKDRLAAAVGANYLQPGKDLLVIDAGTAITYETDRCFRFLFRREYFTWNDNPVQSIEPVYGEIAFGCRAGIHSFGRNGYGNSHPGWSSKWYSVNGWVYRNASAKIS